MLPVALRLMAMVLAQVHGVPCQVLAHVDLSVVLCQVWLERALDLRQLLVLLLGLALPPGPLPAQRPAQHPGLLLLTKLTEDQ